MKSDIAIIGAGIAGIITAYALAKKGNKVTLIDSRRYPAMATSYANGGQLSASNSETWNTTKNIIDVRLIQNKNTTIKSISPFSSKKILLTTVGPFQFSHWALFCCL